MTRFVDRLERELVEAARHEAGRAPRRRVARTFGAAGRGLAPIAVAAVLVALALALPIALISSGGDDRPSDAGALAGSYRSAYTENPRVAPARRVRRGSRLRIAAREFSLETDTYGMVGSVTTERRTIRFQSPGGYARLPEQTTGGQRLPDAGTCQILPGTYTWRLNGERLEFRLVSDPCTARARQLTARPWTRAR